MKLQPILQKLYPQGFYGGQCAEWAEKVLDFGPVGNTISAKKAYIAQSGDCFTAANIVERAKGFRIGDVLFTSESLWFGHVAIIIDIVDNNLILAESNFKLNQRVYYGRMIAKDSPKILGIGRFPFKIDLGVRQVDLPFNCFLNKMKWGTGIFGEITETIKQWTGGKLYFNPFPEMKTQFANWWYEDFNFSGQVYKVVAKSYLDQEVNHFLYPGTLGFILTINHQEWQGTVYGPVQGQEYAWTSFGSRPVQIQMACEEFDMSPWYAGRRAYWHFVIHELGHYLAYINGRDDLTDLYDNPQTKQLEKVFSGLDYNRLALNL